MGALEKERNHKRILIIVISILFVIATILIGGTISGFAGTHEQQHTAQYKYYTSIVIEPGDSLWEIASKYMTSEYKNIEDYMFEVKTLNHLIDDEIMAGEYLTIPYYSTEIL